MVIWQRLAAALEGQNARLHALKLVETDTIYAEYYGV
jgi:hypothetical protein